MARPFLPVLLVLATAFAGCASNPTPTPTDPTRTQDPPPTTNVIHLLAPPKTALEAPTGDQPTLTPIYSSGGPVADTGTVWSYTLNNDAKLTGATAVFHLRATATTTHAGSPVTCTWRARLVVTMRVVANCQMAPPGPLNGDIKLTMPFTVDDLELKKGAKIDLYLHTFTSSSQANPTLAVVTGAKSFDGTLTLEGANETMPPAANKTAFWAR